MLCRLLVHSAKDGWEPLCTFLGVPVPDVPYPHVSTCRIADDACVMCCAGERHGRVPTHPVGPPRHCKHGACAWGRGSVGGGVLWLAVCDGTVDVLCSVRCCHSSIHTGPNRTCVWWKWWIVHFCPCCLHAVQGHWFVHWSVCASCSLASAGLGFGRTGRFAFVCPCLATLLAP